MWVFLQTDLLTPPLPFPSAERSISRPHPLPAGGSWPSQVVKCRCSLSLPGEVYHMPGGQYTKFWFILFSDIFGNIGNGILIFSVIWYIWKYGREFFGNQCCTSDRAIFLDRSHRCQGLLWTSLNFFDYQHWLIIIDYFWVPLSIIDYLLFSVIDHTNAKDFLSPVFQQKCWTLEIIFFLP